MHIFLKPEEVLKQIKLKDNMVAADFGAGFGGWAIPLAKILENGTVYAVDLLEEPLSFLKASINLEKLYNIKPIISNVEDKIKEIKDQSCDLVLMTNLLFQVKSKENTLKEGKRVLKKRGTLLVVDWQKDNPFTAQVEKVSFDKIKELAKSLDFKLEKEFSVGPYHLALLFTKLK